MSAKPTFYDVLGLSKEANVDEIKKAYRKLSLQYHPDRNSSEEAKSKIQQINEAYETLSDQEQRNQYDMELKFGGSGGGGPGMHDFSDINSMFNMVFGQGFPGQGFGGFPGGGFPGPGGGFPGPGQGFPGGFGGPGGPEIRIFHGGPGGPQIFQQMRRPEPIIQDVHITMEQCYQGCTIPVTIERWNIHNQIRSIESETIQVTIPKGIDENMTMTMQDMGNQMENGVRGELKLNIKITNSTQFRRQGMDLIYLKKISLKEALCGFSFEIVHLNGKTLCLNNNNNPTVVKPGFKKIVAGLGIVRDQNAGNMIIEFEIEFPEKLTVEQIEMIRGIDM